MAAVSPGTAVNTGDGARPASDTGVLEEASHGARRVARNIREAEAERTSRRPPTIKVST